jgi:hypothetical protein
LAKRLIETSRCDSSGDNPDNDIAANVKFFGYIVVSELLPNKFFDFFVTFDPIISHALIA